MALHQRILFVDDDPRFIGGLRRLLHGRHSDWALEFVGDSHAAIETARRGGVDAIVTDLHMPGLDGFDLIEALQSDENTVDIPVVVLTGSIEADLKRRVLDCGAIDLLVKPIAADDLFAELRAILRIRQRQLKLKWTSEQLEDRVKRRTAELEASRVEIIWRLAAAGEYRDEDTGNHILRVGWYCRALALALGFDSELVQLLFLTSPLHDIGKIGIPDSVLLKKDKLTSEEWKLMKTHSEIGADILLRNPNTRVPEFASSLGPFQPVVESADNPFMTMAASIARNHHERWSGNGYPRGLKGEDIPMEARLVAVADVYDALRSARPYKKPFSHDKTMSIMREEAQDHFDPRVFEIFEQEAMQFIAIFRDLGDDDAGGQHNRNRTP